MTSSSFDDVIITASSESQAAGYRAHIAARASRGLLPAETTFHVFPDPNGRRVGSGAATFIALNALAGFYKRSLRGTLRDRRVLILHSGGDSRRLPAYAAQGKLFLPLPLRDDRGFGISLFDLLLQDFQAPLLGEGGRVVIGAGDLYLALANQRLDLHGDDLVGVAFRGTADTGTRHGVYIADSTGHVRSFLQKPSLAAAREAGAIDPEGFVLVDTGVVSLSPEAAERLASAVRVGAHKSLLALAVEGKSPALDLYEHVLLAVLSSSSADDYADALATSVPHRRALVAFKERVGSLTRRVRLAPNSRFLHVGTTRELLERLGPGFGADRGGSGRLVLNSVLRKTVKTAGPLLIEASVINKPAALGGDNVVVGVPGELQRSIRLPRSIGMTFLPIGKKDWAVVVFGDRDYFKTPLGKGGTFLNESVPFPSRVELTLWDVPLWKVGTLDESFEHANTLVSGYIPTDEEFVPISWLMANVNHERLLAGRAEVERRTRLDGLVERMDAHAWLSSADILLDAEDKADALRAARLLLSKAAKRPPTARARMFHAAARLLEQARESKAAAAATESAFEAVRLSVSSPFRAQPAPKFPRILEDQVVWATCPARIDLAGGWSDTPPICTDLGGAVVNAAVTLNGQYPLQTVCRLTKEPTIRLNSIDLGRSITFRSADELRNFGDPSDWAALPKAALTLMGYTPREGKSLAKHLEAFGAGLDITVFSALPKGSGMGSSSILGATLIAALMGVTTHTPLPQIVIGLASQLEQLMSTGGGWQDQAGGVVPGVKLLHTAPGENQIPRVDPIPDHGVLASEEASGRCLLYFTGQRRLARNILRKVVGRYLDREPAARYAIEALKHGALAMRDAITSGSLDEVALHLSQYWHLKQMLDPGSTNPVVTRLFERVGYQLSGYSLLGAGGGGFALLIAKDESAAARVRRMLEHAPPSPTARFYDFAIDSKGLGVSRL